jgi:hypothetical protein
MQNVHVVSRPKFHVLSNGALVFGVSLILCDGKWRKHFRKTVFGFNVYFKHIRLNLQENQVRIFEEAENVGQETTLIVSCFTLTLYLYMISAFEGLVNMWNEYKRERTRIARN